MKALLSADDVVELKCWEKTFTK